MTLPGQADRECVFRAAHAILQRALQKARLNKECHVSVNDFWIVVGVREFQWDVAGRSRLKLQQNYSDKVEVSFHFLFRS